VLRFEMRFLAYGTMLTSAYPKRIFGDGSPQPGQAVRGTRPLLLDGAAKALVVVFIVLGIVADNWYTWTGNGGWMDDSLRVPSSVTQVTPFR